MTALSLEPPDDCSRQGFPTVQAANGNGSSPGLGLSQAGSGNGQEESQKHGAAPASTVDAANCVAKPIFAPFKKPTSAELMPPPKHTAPTPSLPDPLRQPQEYLLAIVNRIAATDKEGYFLHPVNEIQAPNYFSVIQQPLCIQDIRERIASGAYKSWKALRDDFTLIHDNARKYNKPTTLVHRQAMALLKNAQKILSTHELELRKALSVLNPVQRGDAAGTTAQPGPSHEAATQAAVPAAGYASEHPPAASPAHEPAAEVKPEPMDCSGHGIMAEQAAQPLQPQVPLPSVRDPIVTYISDSEDADTNDGGKQHSSSLDMLLASLRMSAYRVPYPSLPTADDAAGPSSAGLAAESQPLPRCSGSAGLAGTKRSTRTAGWKDDPARRGIEVRARWLELRMRELQAQQMQLQTQLTQLKAGRDPVVTTAEPITSAAPGARTLGATPMSEGAAAVSLGDVHMVDASAPASSPSAPQGPAILQPHSSTLEPVPNGPVASKDSRLHVQQQALQASAQLFHSSLQQIAFFQLHGSGPLAPVHSLPLTPRLTGPQRPQPAVQASSMQSPGSQAGTAGAPAQSAPVQWAAADERAEKELPGALWASLNLLEQQLHTVKERLETRFKMGSAGQDPAASKAGGLLIGGLKSGLGPGGVGMLSRRQSLGRDRSRAGGMGSQGQRKRSDADGELTAQAARVLERQPSAAIHIPPVRELTPVEQRAREVACTTWRDKLRRQGRGALSHPPPEVVAVLEPGEGSSSEDTSDELYRRLHAIQEDIEHRKYQAMIEKEGRRRNKGAGQNGPGNKTPRGQPTSTACATGTGAQSEDAYGDRTDESDCMDLATLAARTREREQEQSTATGGLGGPGRDYNAATSRPPGAGAGATGQGAQSAYREAKGGPAVLQRQASSGAGALRLHRGNSTDGSGLAAQQKEPGPSLAAAAAAAATVGPSGASKPVLPNATSAAAFANSMPVATALVHASSAPAAVKPSASPAAVSVPAATAPALSLSMVAPMLSAVSTIQPAVAAAAAHAPRAGVPTVAPLHLNLGSSSQGGSAAGGSRSQLPSPLGSVSASVPGSFKPPLIASTPPGSNPIVVLPPTSSAPPAASGTAVSGHAHPMVAVPALDLSAPGKLTASPTGAAGMVGAVAATAPQQLAAASPAGAIPALSAAAAKTAAGGSRTRSGGAARAGRRASDSGNAN